MDRYAVIAMITFFAGGSIGFLVAAIFTMSKISEVEDVSYRRGFEQGQRYMKWTETIRRSIAKGVPSINLKCTKCEQNFYSASPDIYDNIIHIGCGGKYKKSE